MRIDSHQHFWSYDSNEYRFIHDGMAALKRDFLPSDSRAVLSANGFDGCVAVQARQSLAETELLLSLAEKHDFVRGVVGWVDLRAPDVGEVLGELSRRPRFKGVRHIAQSEPPGFLAGARFREGVSRLGRRDLSYDILVYAHQLPEAVELARMLPDVRFVLDHLGKPNVKSGALEPWRAQMKRLGALPNVSCKVSGLVTEADWGAWSPAELEPYLDAVLESFGAERLLVGSDWPVCLLAGSYETVMGAFRDYFAHLSASECALIFGENAARVYRLA